MALIKKNQTASTLGTNTTRYNTVLFSLSYKTWGREERPAGLRELEMAPGLVGLYWRAAGVKKEARSHLGEENQRHCAGISGVNHDVLVKDPVWTEEVQQKSLCGKSPSARKVRSRREEKQRGSWRNH